MSQVKGGQQQSPYFEPLKKAEEAAQLAGLGLWTLVRPLQPMHPDHLLGTDSPVTSILSLQDPVAKSHSQREIGAGDDGE